MHAHSETPLNVLLAALIAFSVAGCGGGSKSLTGPSNTTPGDTLPGNGAGSILTFYTNPAYRELAIIRRSDSGKAIYLGDKDPDGRPLTLSDVIVDAQDMNQRKQTRIAYASDGRPTSSSLAAGDLLKFEWSSTTRATVSMLASDGRPLLRTTIDISGSSALRALRTGGVTSTSAATSSIGAGEACSNLRKAFGFACPYSKAIGTALDVIRSATGPPATPTDALLDLNLSIWSFNFEQACELAESVLGGECAAAQVETGAPPPSPAPPPVPPPVPRSYLQVLSIAPPSPNAGSEPQTIVVSGTGFRTGLEATVGLPGGGPSPVGGAQISDVRETSFRMRVTLLTPGTYSLRVKNPDLATSNLLAFRVAGLSSPPPAPASVLSPVEGRLRMTSSNLHIRDGLWEFDQHKGGFHRPGGGLRGSDDTNAWDVNLYTSTDANADVGAEVHPAADGEVVEYAGLAPGETAGAVLVAHPTRQNASWWSGYLHMTGIAVASGQRVTRQQVLGKIGRVGADNDHLHFVVYTGANEPGKLRSFNASIVERTETGPGSQAPNIQRVSTSSPIASPADQPLTVTGTNFQAGLRVTVTLPGGGTSSLSGTQIRSVTATSFEMLVTLRDPGNYSIRVQNPDGQQSNTYAFTASASEPATPPTINSISPSSPSAGSSDQRMTVFGTNFLAGLTVAVGLPGGGSSTLSGTQVQGVASNSFQIIITLRDPGAYSLRVINPNGQQSNVFGFSVGSAAPAIISISPSVPVSGPTDQTMTVSGNNFESGLTVSVAWSTGSATLSGTQIRNVSHTSFQMLITLGTPGAYSLRVINPNGQSSNTLTFTAVAPATLRIDGGTSSTKQIGQTFSYTGNGYSAGRTVTRYVDPPVNGQPVLAPTLSADSSGNISWSFTPTCGNPIGTFTIYAVDDATGRRSNSVTQTVSANSACK